MVDDEAKRLKDATPTDDTIGTTLPRNEPGTAIIDAAQSDWEACRHCYNHSYNDGEEGKLRT